MLPEMGAMPCTPIPSQLTRARPIRSKSTSTARLHKDGKVDVVKHGALGNGTTAENAIITDAFAVAADRGWDMVVSPPGRIFYAPQPIAPLAGMVMAMGGSKILASWNGTIPGGSAAVLEGTFTDDETFGIYDTLFDGGYTVSPPVTVVAGEPVVFLTGGRLTFRNVILERAAAAHNPALVQYLTRLNHGFLVHDAIHIEADGFISRGNAVSEDVCFRSSTARTTGYLRNFLGDKRRLHDLAVLYNLTPITLLNLSPQFVFEKFTLQHVKNSAANLVGRGMKVRDGYVENAVNSHGVDTDEASTTTGEQALVENIAGKDIAGSLVRIGGSGAVARNISGENCAYLVLVDGAVSATAGNAGPWIDSRQQPDSAITVEHVTSLGANATNLAMVYPPPHLAGSPDLLEFVPNLVPAS
jgi:hypothetical protein